MSITATTMDLIWEASTDNVGVTGYNLYTVDGSNVETLFVSLGVVYEYAATGLTPETSYSWVARAVDAQGNISQRSNLVTEVTPILDITAPTIGVLSLGTNGAFNQVLNWTAATDDVGVTDYRIYKDNVLHIASTGLVLTYDVTGLSEYTEYDWKIEATDGSLWSAPSNTVTAFTDDVTAPSAPTISLNSKTQTTVLVDRTVSTDNVAVTGYKWYKDGIYVVDSGNRPYTYTGLTADTQYSFTCKAKDAAGNLSAFSNALVVTTDAVPDVTEPVIGTLSTGTITGSSVVLNWTAATDAVGVTGYRVYKNDVLLITLGNVLTYTPSGLTEWTTYNFKISARDAAGNWSSFSNVVSPKTLDTTNPVAPVIQFVSKTGTTITIDILTAATDIGGSGVEEYLCYKDGAYVDFITLPTDTYTYTGLTEDTQYLLKWIARDFSNNASAFSNVVTTTTDAGQVAWAVTALMNKVGVTSIQVCSTSVNWQHYINDASGVPANGRILYTTIDGTTPLNGNDLWFKWGLSKMQVSSSGVISNFGSCL